MKRLKVIIVSIIIIIVNILTTACWDKVEIEKRAFVLGIGLDKSEEEGQIDVTYQIALPNEIYGAESSGEKKTAWNITTTTPVTVRAEKHLSAQINKVIDTEHAKVIIIGEKLAEEGIGTYMDFFIRDISVRRAIEILVVEGKAKDILKINPPIAKNTSDYISDIIIQNEKNSHRIITEIDLLHLVKSLRRETDFLLPRLVGDKEKVTLSGAAIFKKDKMVGTISSNDIKSVKWLTNDISKGTMIFEDVGDLKGKVVFEIRRGKTKIKPLVKDGDVQFNVKIYVEGNVSEVEDFNFINSTEKTFIEELEHEIEEEIKKECNHIMGVAQDIGVDFLGFDISMRHHNRRWMEENKEQWREYFKRAILNIDVGAEVRRVGLVK